jgi:monovalent cation:H+ antiporter-2, CPA2 family
VLAGVVRVFGYRNVVPMAAGLTLFQVGEFAFVLARVGLSSGTLTNDVYSIVLNTAVATMALTPVVSGLTPRLYERFARRRAADTIETANLPATGLSGHVVVAGFGRVGHRVANALSRLGLACVVIEIDDRRMREAREAGLAVIYGDAGQPVVLAAAGIARARALIVTVAAFPDVKAIVDAARQIQSDLPIAARADGPEAVRALYALGVTEVTSPEFEAAVEMTRQALAFLAVPPAEILQVAGDIRREEFGRPGA